MKKNRGGILNRGKLIVLAVIIAGVLVFSVFFKNRLITSGMEKGLSKMLTTEVKIQNLKSSLLNLSLSIGSFKADNIKIDNISIDLEARALLKGSFILEDLSGTLVSWGLENKNPGPEGGIVTPGAKLINHDFASLLPDPGTVVHEHLSDFATFDLIEKSRTEIEKNSAELKVKLDNLQKGADTIKELSGSISRSKVSSAEEGLTLLKKISETEHEISRVTSQSGALRKYLQEKMEEAARDKKAITESVKDDYSMLDSVISNPAGAGKDFVSGYTATLLQEKTGKYYPLVVQAQRAFKNLTSKKPEEKQMERGKGRKVYFPVKELPRFLLKKGIFSTADGKVTVDILNISSNPELIENNPTFHIIYNAPPSSAAIEGEMLFPENEAVETNIRLTLSNFPISNKQFSCSYNADGEFFLLGEGVFTGSTDMTVIDLLLKNTEGNKLLSNLNRVLSESDQHTIRASFKGEKGNISITVKTSLDKIVDNVSRIALEEASAAIKKKARDEYDTLLSSSMDRWGVSLGVLQSDNLKGERINGEISQYQKVLDAQKDRIRKEIAKYSGTSIIKDAADALKLPF